MLDWNFIFNRNLEFLIFEQNTRIFPTNYNFQPISVFNFDPRQLPNTKDADLLMQPKKSAMRRPSFVGPHFEIEEEEACADSDSDW